MDSWKKNSSKYLNTALTDNNEDVLIRYVEVWEGIKNQIKKINNGSIGEYGKNCGKLNLILMMIYH